MANQSWRDPQQQASQACIQSGDPWVRHQSRASVQEHLACEPIRMPAVLRGRWGKMQHRRCWVPSTRLCLGPKNVHAFICFFGSMQASMEGVCTSRQSAREGKDPLMGIVPHVYYSVSKLASLDRYPTVERGLSRFLERYANASGPSAKTIAKTVCTPATIGNLRH